MKEIEKINTVFSHHSKISHLVLASSNVSSTLSLTAHIVKFSDSGNARCGFGRTACIGTENDPSFKIMLVTYYNMHCIIYILYL